LIGEETAPGAADETSPPDPTGNLDFIQAALRREHHAQLESRGRLNALRLLWRSVWDSHKILLGKPLQVHHLSSKADASSPHRRVPLPPLISTLSAQPLRPQAHVGHLAPVPSCLSSARYSRQDVVRGRTGRLDLGELPLRAGGPYWGNLPGWILSHHWDIHRRTSCLYRELPRISLGEADAQFALIARDNPYALVTLATVISIPISYIILFTSFPGVGTVA
jgi:hypothetical protein